MQRATRGSGSAGLGLRVQAAERRAEHVPVPGHAIPGLEKRQSPGWVQPSLSQARMLGRQRRRVRGEPVTRNNTELPPFEKAPL